VETIFEDPFKGILLECITPLWRCQARV